MSLLRKRIEKWINRETLSYLFFGVTTTLVNLLTYTILCRILKYSLANLIAIIISKLYAYLTNKFFVFRTGRIPLKETMIEFFKFVLARGFTGVIDYFGLIFMVSIMGWDKVLSKYVLQVIIIILNYILGKFMVFRKKE